MMNILNVRNNEQLQAYAAANNQIKYVFFWGHQEKANTVTKSCFSQWYKSPFEIGGVVYQTAEHYMMVEKARLFGDPEIENEILSSTNPGDAKKLGRMIQNFNELLWNQNRFQIVVQANLAKFSQNQALKEFLLATDSRVLVEASPVDRVWGIGLAVDSPHVENPFKWRGDNLLGYALMEVRNILSESV